MSFYNNIRRLALIATLALCCGSAWADTWALRGNLPGTNWDSDAIVFSGSGTTLTCTVSITTTGTYEFKIVQNNGNAWYGNTGTMTSSNCTDWGFSASTEIGNCKIEASIAGTYTFSFNTSSKQLSVTYPFIASTGWYLAGSFNGWGNTTDEFLKVEGESGSVGYVSITLAANTSYLFKVTNKSKWNGLDNKTISSTESNIQLGDHSGGNVTLNTTDAGVYEFAYDVSSRKISVTYPEPPSTYYTVSVTNGTASAASVAEGGSVTLTANDAADCQQFTGWTLSGASVSDLTQNPLTISNVTGDITATANFAAISLPSSIAIALSAESIAQTQSVTITPTPSSSVSGISYTYQYKISSASSWTTASSATITLNDVGSYAVRVVGKVSGCSTEITSEEKTITVTALPTVTIHVKFPSAWFSSYSTPTIWYWKSGADGTAGTMTYEFDDADGGKWYSFEIPYGNAQFLLKIASSWIWQTNNIDVPSAETCYSVVTENNQAATIIDCVEPPSTYTVSVTNGTASAASVAEGGSVTLTANDAADCQQFTGWTLSGASVSDLTQNPLTISNVTGDITATANFAAISLPSSIAIALSAESIAQTQSVTITPTPSSSVSGISYTYQYKISSASSWTTASSATITLNDVGSYAVRVVGKVSGCSTEITSEEKTVTVTALPDVTIHGNFPEAWFTNNAGCTPHIYWWNGSNKGYIEMTYETIGSDGSKWYSVSLPGVAQFFKFCRGNNNWDWQNNSDLSAPSAETCYQLSAESNQAATIIDCPAPSLTFSSSEGTQFVLGTTTTLTAATSNFTGEIVYTISIDGTQVSSKNAYSWTPTAVGTYTAVATASNGTETLTETLQIAVVQSVTVLFRRPKGTEGFGDISDWTQGTPELYVVSTYTSGEYYLNLFTKYTMTHYVTDDSGYEWFVVDNIPEGKQIFFFDGNSEHTYTNYPYYSASTSLVPAANTCYTIENQERSNPNRFVVTTGNCPVISGRYRLRSETRDGRIFYSNIGPLTDTLSVYAAGALYLEKYNDGSWSDSLQLTLPSTLDSLLIIATHDNNTFALAPYEGDIYVRTDGANGGWVNYICSDNRMTNWAPNRALTSEYYDYYWVKWLEQNQNLKAVVANRFNPSIANELGDFVLSSAGANTRFAYDAPSNRFYRNMIGGAGTTKFVEITEVNIGGSEHLIYMDESKGDPVAYQGNDGRLLNDVSNWNYYIDTYCYPGATVHMEGTQADAGTQVLVDSLVVLRGETFPEKPYRVRIIYLFAQNRIVHAWLPDGEYDDDYDIGSGVLFVREDDVLKNTLTMSETAGAKVIADRIYMCLEINKSNWLQKRAVKQQVYFFSLPYTCKISDIYGSFDQTDYGTKWIIQRYRGDLRAQYGLVGDATYWATMKPTATLEANRGYVLCTNFEESDFKEASGVSRLRFYFPSVGTDFTFAYQVSTTSTLESYPCTINIPESLIEYGNGDRRQLDNDWHVIGTPGFLSMQVANVDIDPSALNYVYKYTMRSSADAKLSSQYALYSTADDFVLEPFYSYFVQYAGDITWKAYTNVTPNQAPAAPRTKAVSNTPTERYPLTISHTSGAADRMYITLSDDGTTDIVSNRDVLKLLTTGYAFPQMYALSNKEKFAAIDLPKTTQTIALGLYFGTAGQYTIALTDNATQHAEKVLLHDKMLDQFCDLAQGDYIFEAAVGTNNDRFELTISRKSSVVTERPEATASAVELFGIDGQLRAVNLADGDCVRLYDAVGRLVASRRAANGQVAFDALHTGVYIVVIDTANNHIAQKVVVSSKTS